MPEVFAEVFAKVLSKVLAEVIESIGNEMYCLPYNRMPYPIPGLCPGINRTEIV